MITVQAACWDIPSGRDFIVVRVDIKHRVVGQQCLAKLICSKGAAVQASNCIRTLVRAQTDVGHLL